MSRRAAAALVAALAIAGACGRRGADAGDSAGAARAPRMNAARGGTAAADDCPRTGHWSDCQVRKRLEQAGVAPRLAPTPVQELPKVGATPTVYLVGTSELAVYLFADSVTRHRAALSLDTLHFVAPTHGLTIRGEATVIENDNVLAILFSRRDQQRERVSDALSAGAPQR